ncbi:MAG: TonB-dependent receptor [Prevotella sp.]|nr:TonB-dependent receptor [Prevotella sp.]
MFSPSTTPFMPSERLATKCTFEVTQNMNAYDARVYGVEAAYQRDFGFITPALRCLGFYGNYTYTHSTTRNYNSRLGIEDGDDVKMAELLGITRQTLYSKIKK